MAADGVVSRIALLVPGVEAALEGSFISCGATRRLRNAASHWPRQDESLVNMAAKGSTPVGSNRKAKCDDGIAALRALVEQLPDAIEARLLALFNGGAPREHTAMDTAQTAPSAHRTVPHDHTNPR